MRITVVAAAICLSIVGLSVADEAHAAFRTPTNIPPQSLGSALQQLTKERDLQLVYRSEVVKELRTGGASGELTPIEALTQILTGTGLTFRYLDEKTVTIIPIAAAPLTDAFGAGPSSPSVQPPASTDGDRKTEEGKKGFLDRFRVAQVDQGTPPDTSTVNKKDDQDSKKKKNADELEQVVVTGTHIRGATNDTAPLQVITREDIERSGYATTQDLVRSIPQNFSGGALNATEDGQLGPGSLAAVNTSYATGINLRGLGESSTLVLIDGHRMAPSDTGIVVDVSAIPLSAIERVEIMTDGASAIYGADAVAGVVNFILRKGYSGQDTWMQYGSAVDRTRPEEVIGQSVGREWTGGNGVVSLQYQKLGALNASDRSFTSSTPSPTDLLPESHQYSALFNVHQDLTPGFDIASDALYTRRDDVAHLANQFIAITSSPISQQGAANVTIGYQPTDKWRVEASGSYSRAYNSYTEAAGDQPGFPIFGCASSAPCHFDHFKNDFSLWSADLKVDGTVLRLPGGDMKGAIGASYQKESSSFLFIENPPESPFARHVSAEFAELQIPLVGSANALPLVSQLGLSLAVRHDDYSDFGTTTNPRYGVSWKPRDDLHIRGAYSTSFRAPNAYEQTRSLTGLLVVTQLLESPTGGTVPTFVVAGQTGVLKPEKARNVNFGFDYEPLFLKDLTVSFDYYDILYRDRIITPTPNANSLLTPDVYGPLITPLQDDAAAQAYLNSYLAQGATFLDNLGTGFTGVRYAFSSLEQNAAQVRQRGLDLALRYAFAVGPNRFHISLNGAYIDEIETAFTSSSTPTNTVNTYGNPLRVRAREEFSWNRGRFEVAAAVNYNGNYINTAVPGNPPIASWTDADLRFRYQPSFSNGLSLGLSVSNVFNRDPPYVSDQGGGTPGIHYDVGNGNPVGRLVVIDARKAW